MGDWWSQKGLLERWLNGMKGNFVTRKNWHKREGFNMTNYNIIKLLTDRDKIAFKILINKKIEKRE